MNAHSNFSLKPAGKPASSLSFKGKISDQVIKAEIQKKLLSTSTIDERWIEVRVKDGMVLLDGHVSQDWMKYQVEGWVEQIAGIGKVENRITIEPFFDIYHYH